MEAPKEKFERLASVWEERTQFLSDGGTQDPLYKEITEMGEDVVPLMLQDFVHGRYRHWFKALYDITKESPITNDIRGRVKLMAKAWIAWGKEKGYLS